MQEDSDADSDDEGGVMDELHKRKVEKTVSKVRCRGAEGRLA